MRAVAALVLALLVSACATPEARVRSGLQSAGLSKALSACMAERMVDRLNLLQLRRLGRLSRFRDDGAGEMTTERFLHNARALRDPEIIAVMTSSAAVCAIRPR